jgi:hypothetical protein
LDLEQQGCVHVIIGTTPALRGHDISGRVSRACIGRGILIRKDHLGNVITGKIFQQERLIIGQLGIDISSGTIASEWVGMVVGKVIHVPSRRP